MPANGWLPSTTRWALMATNRVLPGESKVLEALLREVASATADLAAARIRVVVARDQDPHHEGVYDDNRDSNSHD